MVIFYVLYLYTNVVYIQKPNFNYIYKIEIQDLSSKNCSNSMIKSILYIFLCFAHAICESFECYKLGV